MPSLNITIDEDGKVTFEHVDQVGDQCLEDQFMQAMKEHGEIIEQGFTEDHGKPQPVVYAQQIKAGR